MSYMLLWVGMIIGQLVSLAIGITDLAGAATASYWCGCAIFACWLFRRSPIKDGERTP